MATMAATKLKTAAKLPLLLWCSQLAGCATCEWLSDGGRMQNEAMAVGRGGGQCC